jgi:hypothetical protein
MGRTSHGNLLLRRELTPEVQKEAEALTMSLSAPLA